MPTNDPGASARSHPEPVALPDEAQLAAVSFLARYSGRTLEAYTHRCAGGSLPTSVPVVVSSPDARDSRRP